MGLGVLESSHTSHVVGSTILLEKEQDADATEKIVLRPTPSDSPNDPLNWPLWKKNLVTFTLSLCVGLGGIQGGVFSVATAIVTEDYQITIIQAERFSSYPYLACGSACLLASIASRTFGKRSVYLISVALEFCSAIWSALATSYHSQLASRLVGGLGIGAFESVVLASIGDVYFVGKPEDLEKSTRRLIRDQVHQRGRPMAFYSAMGLGCVQLSPIIGGYVTDKYGWRTQFWILTAFWAVTALLVFFGVPETTYHRPVQLETDMVDNSRPVDDQANFFTATKAKAFDPSKGFTHEAKAVDSGSTERRRSFWQELLPVRGIETSDNPIKLTVRLFCCALYPALWMAFLANGTFVGWFLAIITVLAQIFSVPPFNFTPTGLGYLNALCFPGAIVAFAYTHLLSDRILKWCVRRNRNVYEPEFRLVLLVPSVVVGALGFALFGWYAGDVAGHQVVHWALASLFYGLIIFATVAAQSIAYVYLLDSHRDVSVEMGVLAIMLRNFFSYGAATFLPLWLQASSVADVFYAIAGFQGGVIAVPALLMYVFGKRLRAFMQLHSPMRALGVDALRPL